MIKSKLVISMAAFLLLSPGGTQARFLEYPSTDLIQDDGTTRVISSQSPSLEQPTTLFNANLNCGECVVSGYIYCVQGDEGFSGTIPQKGVCCQNSRSCPQINTKGWVCSSKYDNMTLVDKLRVCPFDQAQCGSQSLNFNTPGDSQCLRLRTLKKGSTCLYKVKSKCGVPRFLVNDTSSDIFSSSVQVANRTVDRSSVDKCNGIRNQNCICRENSVNGAIKYVCDCETAVNIDMSPRDCATCTRVADALGNTLQACSCPLQVPIQAFEDQICACDRLTNAASKNTTLSCVCPKPSPRVVSFTEDRCKCLNNYNATTKKAYLECSCRNTEICTEPVSRLPAIPKPARAPCSITYPCDCNPTRQQSQNVTGNNTRNSSAASYQCLCTNPSNQMFTVVPSQPVSNCSCAVKVNVTSSSWYQDCDCCLPDDLVRTQLLPPTICSSGAAKQTCDCRNQTVTVAGRNTFQQVCNCVNPTSNVIAPNLVFNNNGCDCENTLVGNKSCTCCVAQEVQAAQLQPKCDAPLDSCRCTSNSTNGRLTCSCDSKKFNFTYNPIVPATKDCYCAPLAANQTQRACNCCLSDNQYQQVRPQCPVGRDAQTCKCTNVPATNTTAASLFCDCQNRFFFNQVTSRIPLAPQQCACYNRNGTTSDCTCCTNEVEIMGAPTSCPASQVYTQCNRCANVTNPQTRRSVYQCNCATPHPDNSSITLSTSVAVNTTSCGCINSNGRAICNCCVTPQSFQTARPICTNDQQQERCTCQNVNVTELASRTVFELVNRTNLAFTCRRTGFNGDLCLNSTSTQVTPWTDALACYSSANAKCEYQTSTRDCGWTSTPALTSCLAKPAPISNPRQFQNLTFPPAPTVVVSGTFNQSRVVSFNQTINRLSCNCSNTRVPQYPIANVRVSPPICGCDTPVASRPGAPLTQTCDCCLNRRSMDGFIFDSFLCRADQAPQVCTFDRVTNLSTCTPSNALTTQYTNMRIDVTRNCVCLNATNTTQNCKCCLPSNINQLIPAAPVCNPGQGLQSGCRCSPVGRTAIVNCTCPDGNSTRVETFIETIKGANNLTSNVTRNRTVITPKFVSQNISLDRCGCLNTVNNGTFSQQCNCCLFRPLTCAAPQFVDTQACDCRNVSVNVAGRLTNQWSCNCLRRDNNARGQFNITNQTLCNYNPELQVTQCCITKAQYDSQIPFLNCPANSMRQSCQCSNLTRQGDRNCTCTRTDNGIPGQFRFPEVGCLCGGRNSTTNNDCSCCVDQSFVDQQIPRKKCDVEGPGFAPEFCKCTANRAPATGLNCTCAKAEYQIQRQYNFGSSFCLNQTGSRFECCLNQEQRDSLIPRLTCDPASEIPQTGCRCKGTQSNGRVQQVCDCPITYQRTNYTLFSLTSQNNGCMCNGTTCGCCLTPRLIEEATERICRPNEIRSVCQSCVNVTDAKTRAISLSCSGCNTFPQDSSVVIIRAQSYQNVAPANCLCRNEVDRTNCTCCQPASRVPLVAAPPACVNGTQLVSNTRCDELNTTSSRCNITRREGVVETYFLNVSQADLAGCNCFTITNGTQTFRQCQCCASPLRLSPSAPNCSAVVEPTIESCSCLSVRGPNRDSRLNCDCNFRGVQIVRDLNFQNQQCGCLQSNTVAKPCQCCASLGDIRDRIAPAVCEQGSPLATCASTNTSVVDPRTRALNFTLRGDCVAVINNTTFTNNNMTLDPSRCVCFNDTQGKLQCRCCSAGAQNIRNPVQRQCRAADQLSSSCNCVGNSSCSCTAFNGVNSYPFSLRPNSSDCNCVVSAQANRGANSTCSCCLPRSLINIATPTCDASSTTTQQCLCRNVNSTSQVCDCTRSVLGRIENRNGVELRADRQCNCLSQFTNGVPVQNCTCCVPNPPPTLCQRLAAPGSNALPCSCRDVIVDGKITSNCSCSQRLNATSSVTRNGLILDEANNCCCTEVVNPVTRVGSRVCNCTLPTVQQNQNCQCRGIANDTRVNCSCTDCNRVRKVSAIPQNRCQCRGPITIFNREQPSLNTTNSTTNTTRPANGTTNSTTNNTRPANSTTNSTTNNTRPANTTTNSTTNTTRPSTNTTANTTSNSTANVTVFGVDCVCQVDFNSICAPVNVSNSIFVNEGTCDLVNAYNLPVPSVSSAQCTNEYEYLVAVVASNRDANVILNVQSLQAMSGYYLSVSLFALVILALSQLF